MKHLRLCMLYPLCLAVLGCSIVGPPGTDATARNGKHLFILSGQSNMVGMDPDLSFTPTVAEAFGGTNIIVVKDAHSGQSIRSWAESNHEHPPPTVGRVPKVRGELYQRLMSKVRSAIDGETLRSVTFIWMQGESDLRNTAYEAYLNELLQQVKRDLARPDVNVVIGRISDNGLDQPKRLEGRKYIRRTQADVADAAQGAWVNTDDLNDRMQNGKLVHDLHYTRDGYRILGQRFADAAIRLVKQSEQW